jgi:TRAP-type mannitol/chloroaromatic compound transport system permease small subunit
MINIYQSLDGKIDYKNSVGNLNLFIAKTKILIGFVLLILAK